MMYTTINYVKHDKSYVSTLCHAAWRKGCRYERVFEDMGNAQDRGMTLADQNPRMECRFERDDKAGTPDVKACGEEL